MTQVLKMGWMFFWRFAVLLALFNSGKGMGMAVGISLVLALAIRFGLHSTMRVWPILNLFRGRHPLVSLVPVQGGGQGSGMEQRKVIHRATNPGTNTGYEPRYLENVAVPSGATVRNMRNRPGQGLSNSGFNQENVATGQAGEVNFAKALAITSRSRQVNHTDFSQGILQGVHSFWSVAMPSEESIRERDPRFDTDIDCVLVSGNSILLVDTKFYKSGDVTYTSEGNRLYCVDNATGSLVGKPKNMSRNMAMAQDRFHRHFPTMDVSSIVVLMPTDSGSPQVGNVFWPGGIPAMDINAALNQVARISNTRLVTSPKVLMDISRLLKR